MIVAATFHGPNYGALVHDESSIEVFHSLGHAMSALFDRYDSSGARALDAHYLDGHTVSTYWPLVTEGHYLRCYLINGYYGQRHADESTILDALTAVHDGTADYVLTLVPSENDTVSITVQRGA